MMSSQMLKGVLEGCVLALVGRGETYGYELVGTLARCGLGGVAEGTLYPLLLRLEKKGLIASTYRASDMGPRRKYYRITEAGAAEVEAFAEEFGRLARVVDTVLADSASHDGAASGAVLDDASETEGVASDVARDGASDAPADRAHGWGTRICGRREGEHHG